MNELGGISKHLTTVSNLEKSLHLKQMQISGLLAITKGIGMNYSAADLFSEYKSFLDWVLGVKYMLLFIRENDKWELATSLRVPENLLRLDIIDKLSTYLELQNIEGDEHPLIKNFDIVIPINHKDQQIAYVFVGGFLSEDDDIFSKVQIITAITQIIAVAIENKRLFRSQLDKERLNHEMELAAEVQKMLIPKKLPISLYYEFDSIYKPKLGVGGDYFDYIQFDDGKLVFCVGDFTGKGVSAALLMSNFQANFHTLIKKRTALDPFIRDLNKTVFRLTEGERFITFFIAEYDIYTHSLTYINAGHNPPFLLNGNEIIELKDGCILLGPFPEIPHIDTGYVKLDRELPSMILTYTDGITDIMNEKGAYFNETYLKDFLLEHSNLSVSNFNEQLNDFIDTFKGTETYPDDFTVLTGKFNSPKALINS
jgi:sigma-B regulation protein RsbU (phosphoserine phosphatase)